MDGELQKCGSPIFLHCIACYVTMNTEIRISILKERVNKMSLYCRKCGSPIPEDSIFCLKCGEKVVYVTEPPKEDEIQNDSFTNAHPSEENKATQTQSIFKRLITFQWIDDLSNKISSIPKIGPTIDILYIFILAMIGLSICCLVVYGIYLLTLKNQLLGYIVFFALFDSIAFYGSYMGGGRKKWFFWVSVLLTIVAFANM